MSILHSLGQPDPEDGLGDSYAGGRVGQMVEDPRLTQEWFNDFLHRYELHLSEWWKVTLEREPYAVWAARDRRRFRCADSTTSVQFSARERDILRDAESRIAAESGNYLADAVVHVYAAAFAAGLK